MFHTFYGHVSNLPAVLFILILPPSVKILALRERCQEHHHLTLGLHWKKVFPLSGPKKIIRERNRKKKEEYYALLKSLEVICYGL